MATSVPTKSKSGLLAPSNHKTTPATPRISKLNRVGSAKSKSDADSPSPQQIPRPSIDRSPRSAGGSVNRRSPTVSTPPEKQSRPKAPDLQAQLNALQDEFKKAKEQLTSSEKEKSRVVEELKDAKKLAEEASEGLKVALLAQKKAEESLEIEKFRADEMEQSGIEAVQRKEEQWKKELEAARAQHGADAAALLSVAEELERVKQELVAAGEAKDAALVHAEDAMRIAEINSEKVEVLNAEVGQLKFLMDIEVESKSNEAKELVGKLDGEIRFLKDELERAKGAEGKLVEIEGLVEKLRAEVDVAKRAESDARDVVEKLTEKVDSLQAQLEGANSSESSIRQDLASVRRELEENGALLRDTESEMAFLKGKVEALQFDLTRQQQELEESNISLNTQREETAILKRTVEGLKSELQKVEDEKMQAVKNENIAASKLEDLTEENDKLSVELEITKEEGEKIKKVMEGLTSALHEVSTEARETEGRFLEKEVEIENAHAQIEELESTLRTSKESYEVMLDEAKYEIVRLKRTIETCEIEAENSRAERDAKESNFISSIKISEEEIATITLEKDYLVEALKRAENEKQAAEEEGVELLSKLKQAEVEASLAIESMEELKVENLQLKERLSEKENEVQSFKEAANEEKTRLLEKVSRAESEASVSNRTLEELKCESLELRERLLDKENELQSISQENDDLHTREAAALEKIKELSVMLSEATVKKIEEKTELSNGEMKHKMPTKHEETEPADDVEELKLEVPNLKVEDYFREELKTKEENGNGKAEEDKPIEAEKDFSLEREHAAESVNGDEDLKVNSSSGLSSENIESGATSPTKQQQQSQKKKKPLLQKFGSLLKKKSSNQK